MLFQLLLLTLVNSQCEFPTMSIGNFNIATERQLKEVIKKEPSFLIGITSKNCTTCCSIESVYSSFMDLMAQYSPKIPLIRLDISVSPFINKYIFGERDQLPVLYGVRKGVFYKYADLPDAKRMLRFADKLTFPVYIQNDLEKALKFLEKPKGQFESLKVLGLFEDKDLLEDYEKAISPFLSWFAVEFWAVTDKSLIKSIRKIKTDIKQMNSLVLMRVDETKYLDLEIPQDIESWVAGNCVGLVEELTPFNYPMYETGDKLMLVMLIDPLNQYTPGYLDLYTNSARKYSKEVYYTWLDGTTTENIERRKGLGLITQIMPALSFNFKSSMVYPMPEGLDFTEKNINNFVQGYLDGKKAPHEGKFIFNGVVLEDCTKVTNEEFVEEVLESTDDVLFILYSSHLSKQVEKHAATFNRVCKRFNELAFEGLRVRALDAATQRVHAKVYSGTIPGVFFKADNGELIRYEGVFNALEIMRFVEKNGKKGVKLPKLPHLDENEVKELKKSEKEMDEKKSNKDSL